MCGYVRRAGSASVGGASDTGGAHRRRIDIVFRLLPSFFVCILFAVLLGLSMAYNFRSLHALESSYQRDVATVNAQLSTIETKQLNFQKQTQALTTLVKQSLNATDEYMTNITQTVSEAENIMDHDVATVSELADNQNSLLAVQFAGMFTILTALVSGWHLSQHLRNLHEPVVQRKIMAVLWMTPIYSVTSWLSLVFPQAEPYLAAVREFYEAYCVYTFLSFLISVLGRGDRNAVVDLLESKASSLSPPDRWCCEGSHSRGALFSFNPAACTSRGKDRRDRSQVPGASEEEGGGQGKRHGGGDAEEVQRGMSAWTTGQEGGRTSPSSNAATAEISSLSSAGGGEDDRHAESNNPRRKAEDVLDQCQRYAMQFVLLRPLTAVGWLVSNKLVTPKGFLDWGSPQVYIVTVTNLSIFFAFRGLVKFYHATRDYLAWCNPWPKFLCIKGVVFMTFWQKMVISIIVNFAYADKFNDGDSGDSREFIMAAQNFLICLEMLFAAIAHCFVFSPDEWAEGYREREEQRKRSMGEARFGDNIALRDFIQDVKTVMTSSRGRRVHGRRRKRRRDATGGLIDNRESGESAEALTPRSPVTSADEYDLSLSTMDYRDDDHIGGESAVGNLEGAIGKDSPGMELSRPSRDNAGLEMAEEGNDAPSVRRPRLDTGESCGSDAGDNAGGSWARIERYLDGHSSGGLEAEGNAGDKFGAIVNAVSSASSSDRSSPEIV